MITHITVEDAAKLISRLTNANEMQALTYIREAAGRGEIQATAVAPVRHGRWYLAEDAVFRCSECGRICYELNAPYCYCGARMEKESEHETD